MTRHRPPLILTTLIVVLSFGCSTADPAARELSTEDQRSISDSIRALLESTYVFTGTDPVPRFMALYADTGSVVSAASGGFTLTRDSVAKALNTFWTTTGQYMQRPAWTWGAMKVDVLSRDAAVVTARYTIPHWTPAGRPHVLGGAWTSVWTRRNGRWAIVQEHLSDLPRAVAERVEATMPPAPPGPRR